MMSLPGDDLEPAIVASSRSARSRRWVLDAIGWDGGLPLAVALTPEVLRRLDVRATPAELIGVIFIPIVAGLIRAHHARRQLTRFGHTTGTWWRQLLLAGAICILMVVEAGLTILQKANGPDLVGWLVVGGLYLIYLTGTLTALRPTNRVEPRPVASRSTRR